MEQFNPFEYKSYKEIPREEKDNYKKVESGFVTDEAFEKQQEAKNQTKRSFSEWVLRKEKTPFLDVLHEEALKDDETFNVRKASQVENPNFLKEKYNLHAAPEIESAAKRTEMRTGEKLSQNPAERIQNYLNRLKGAFEIKDHERRERLIAKIKEILHEKFVIKEEEIPEAYFNGQRQIAREQGRGDIEITSEIKKQLSEVLISDQKSSLDNWVDYLSSEDAVYPDWLKYWAFRSVLGMGKYDKEKKQFVRRDLKKTVAPFPDINHEALAYVLDAIQKKHSKGAIKFKELDDTEREEFGKLLQGENFAKLYAFAIEKVTPASQEQIILTKGEWVKYEKGSDHLPLVDSLQGHGTGWCTAGESTAKIQLGKGDFYVYYSINENGEPKIPRAAIRTENGRIAEVRGIAEQQNLDPYIADVVKEKLSEFQDGSAYEKKTSDMKMLTEIERKTKIGAELNRLELSFLYEVDEAIEGFGYQRDPRVKEILDNRNFENDKLIIFECTESQIANDVSQINENTKAYIGEWNIEIFQKIKRYPNIQHVFESFPDKKIFLQYIDTDPKINSWKAVKKAFEKEGIQNIAEDFVLQQIKFSKISMRYDLVKLNWTQLGLQRNATFDQIYQRAKEFGLEPCPAEVAPNLRLQTKSKDWKYIAIEPIKNRGNKGKIFSLYCSNKEHTFADADIDRNALSFGDGGFVFRYR